MDTDAQKIQSAADAQLKETWNWNFTNHKPTEAAIRKIEGLRSAARAMKDAIIDMGTPSRERSLALTNLENTLFYAVASVARYETEEAEIANATADASEQTAPGTEGGDNNTNDTEAKDAE